MIHEIKCYPRHFESILNKEKTFEVTDNHKCYQKGDAVIMNEWDSKNDKHTGRSLAFKVGFVFPLEGTHQVVLSILDLEIKPDSEKDSTTIE